MNKIDLIERVIFDIKKDILMEDLEALTRLLENLNDSDLRAFLREE